jgi:hypothetical protein
MECDVNMGLLGFRFSISQSEMNKEAVRIDSRREVYFGAQFKRRRKYSRPAQSVIRIYTRQRERVGGQPHQVNAQVRVILQECLGYQMTLGPAYRSPDLFSIIHLYLLVYFQDVWV